MSHFVIVRSRDRKPADNSHDFRVYFDRALSGTYFFSSASIPRTWYTCDSTNNRIYFNENATDKTASITPGNYTTTSLATAVETALNNASSGFANFSVAFSSATHKYTITSDQTFSLKFASNTLYSAHELLGFSATDTSPGTTATSQNIANLSSDVCCHLVIQQAKSTYHSAREGVIQATAIIPLTGSWGDVVRFTPEVDERSLIIFESPTSYLDICIKDSRGIVRSLNNVEWEFTLVRKC